MKKILIMALAASGILTSNLTYAQDTFRYKFGDNELILLSEGQVKGDPGILIDPPAGIVGKYIPDGTFPMATNAFLIRDDGMNILFDTGYGTKLLDNLRSLGLEPWDIHEILLTHMHGDHIGGLINDGAKTFKNAQLVIGSLEYDYWMSDAEMNKVPENRRGSFVKAREVIDLYSGDIELLEAIDISMLPDDVNGIYPVAAYGHTPGHIGYLVAALGEKIFIWGDLTHAMAVQMPDPSIAVTYDVDPDAAVKSRLAVLNYVTEHNIPVAGIHIPYPGIGTISRSGDTGFEFTPAE